MTVMEEELSKMSIAELYWLVKRWQHTRTAKMFAPGQPQR